MEVNHVEKSDEDQPNHSDSNHSFSERATTNKLSLPKSIKSSNNKRPNIKRLVPTLLIIIISVASGFLGGWIGSDHNSQNDSVVSPIESKQTVVSSESGVISTIAKEVGQSVVSIDATQAGSTSNNTTNDLFDLGPQQPSTSEDAGTGIIISADGLIITNRHVVPAGTTSVSVTLSDGTQYNNVQIIGRTSADDSLDIAFLKITNLNGKKLIPATIGDSSQMAVGDAVVAIGNALGQFQNTVTSGILSGYGRSVEASDSTGTTEENLVDLFQTDAAINEGNSGGPLVNLSGQVIGINTAIASDSQNIGFAIPIDDVTGLIKSVEETGTLQRPYLGIIYISLTNAVAQQYNLSVSQGAYIPSSSAVGQSTIISGGPADKAGLKAGDVITKVDGTSINETNDLTAILDKDSVGQVVTLTIVRGHQTLTLKATLVAAPTG